MAEPEFITPGPPTATGRKPRPSVYTILLVIALVALLVGCLFLYLEVQRFGGFGAVRGRVAQAAVHETSDPLAAADRCRSPLAWGRFRFPLA